jgi:hypothetical protein
MLVQGDRREVRFKVYETAGEEQVCVDPAGELEARPVVVSVFAVRSRMIVILGKRMLENQVTEFRIQ